jgi:tryptophanyl-tRNA synthetase
MAKILTGIQSTGTPHLGNLLGAIIPAIELSNNPDNQSFLFIADLHSITQIKDGETLRKNTYSTAAAWLACGLDINKVTFYRQSDSEPFHCSQSYARPYRIKCTQCFLLKYWS